jgi:hypothetical protein
VAGEPTARGLVAGREWVASRTTRPAELKADMDEMNSLAAGPPTYYDIERPWLYSPR